MTTIKYLINLFGGHDDLIIILLFIITLYLLNSLVKNRKIRVITAIVSTLFVIFQLSSLFFTQSFVGYLFFANFDFDDIEGLYMLYIPQIVAGVVALVLLIIFFFRSRKILLNKISDINPRKARRIKVLISSVAIALLAVIMLCSDFVSDTRGLISFVRRKPIPFEEVLAKNGMNSYTTPENIKSSRGKNAIIISLESFEQGYLVGEKFKKLTPNIRKLMTEWNYYKLYPNSGSNWTSGSLYTLLTGFPSYLGPDRNKIFFKVENSGITSIAHILGKAGYKSIYMNGNAEFSHNNELVTSLNYDKVIDYKTIKESKSRANRLDRDAKSEYGLRDLDLFKFAKEELDTLISTNRPFSLLISTTDTHFPKGIYDKRMEKVLPKNPNELLFMISAVDNMVGDFINYLKTNNILDSSAVFIFPDHLKMGDPSIFEGTGERGLYLLTNVDLGDSSKLSLSQIDLPKMILKGMQVEHNAKFLTDFLPVDQKNEFVNREVLKITEINSNGLKRTRTKR